MSEEEKKEIEQQQEIKNEKQEVQKILEKDKQEIQQQDKAKILEFCANKYVLCFFLRNRNL